MFRKRDDEGRPEPPYEGAPAPAPVAPSYAQDDDTTSLIGPGLHVVGTVTTAGNLQVEGSIQGDVHANFLTIGQEANIHGDIVSEDVVVSGTVNGSIRSDKVRLANTAVVQGKIIHRLFAIESGAQFDGQVEHSQDPLGRSDQDAWSEEQAEPERSSRHREDEHGSESSMARDGDGEAW